MPPEASIWQLKTTASAQEMGWKTGTSCRPLMQHPLAEETGWCERWEGGAKCISAHGLISPAFHLRFIYVSLRSICISSAFHLRFTRVSPAFCLRFTCLSPAFLLRFTCVLSAFYLRFIHCSQSDWPRLCFTCCCFYVFRFQSQVNLGLTLEFDRSHFVFCELGFIVLICLNWLEAFNPISLCYLIWNG